MSTNQILLSLLTILSLILVLFSFVITTGVKAGKKISRFLPYLISAMLFVVLISIEILFVIFYLKFLGSYGFAAILTMALIMLFIILPALSCIPTGIIPSGIIPKGIIPGGLKLINIKPIGTIRQFFAKLFKK
jgi:hypothetical protein